MTYEHNWYSSPIKLPQASSGHIRIEHTTVQGHVSVVGMRQALLRGIAPVSAMVVTPLKVHNLVDKDHGLWMTDLPEELNQIHEMIHTAKPHGNVLIGGLGLGIMAKIVADQAGVRNVVVIERDKDVIKLCRPKNAKYVVMRGDINDYLQSSLIQYDCYLLDTWQGTNESTWFRNVLPQKRAIRNRFGREPTIHCWAEDIMQGQIMRSLMSKRPHWFYSGLPVPMNERTARAFVDNVGMPAWERRYGKAMTANLSNDEN